MINELEKKFFDTFGIEPKFKGYSNTEELSTGGVIPCGNIKYFNTIEEMDKANYWCFSMRELDDEDKEYPQITDHILLKLICILNPYYYPSGENIQHLKEGILEWCIKYKEDIKHKVRTLFEEI